MRETDGELDLEDYVALFRRRWRWVAATVLVVAGLVALFTLTREEVYESRAEVQILTEENQTTFNISQPDLFRSAIAELQFIVSSRYDNAVDDLAGFDVDVDASLRLVSTSEKTEDAGIILFRVREASPSQARIGADAAVEAYLTDRLARMTNTFQQRVDNDTASRDALREERRALNEEVAAAFAAAADESDILTAAQLQIEAELLQEDYAPRITTLTNVIAGLTNEISRNNGILSTLTIPESTARVNTPASLPRQPVSPDVPRNVMLGIVVGLILGLILAVMRDLLDTRARDGAELAQLVDIPVMATIGEIRSQRSAPGRVRRYRDLSAEESSGYQVLLNSLWLTNVDDPLQSIVFTSDRPEVGKTQTVVNLAQAEAARGTRVLVIDTDFVNPSVASRLDLDGAEIGLADLLEGRVTAAQVIQPTEIANLHIIDAQGASGAGELLRSDRLGAVLGELYSNYDLILIDSPPTLSTSDSRLVASQADAVVVVYDPSESRREELQRTIDLLRSARANLIGLVANRSRASHPVYLSARER